MKLQWAEINTLGRLERYLARPPGNQARSGRKNRDSDGRCRQTSWQDGGEVGKEGERKKKKKNRETKTRKDAARKRKRNRNAVWSGRDHKGSYTPTEPSLAPGLGPLPTRIKASPRRLRNMIPSGLTYSCHNLLPFPHLNHPKDPGAQPSWY